MASTVDVVVTYNGSKDDGTATSWSKTFSGCSPLTDKERAKAFVPKYSPVVDGTAKSAKYRTVEDLDLNE